MKYSILSDVSNTTILSIYWAILLKSLVSIQIVSCSYKIDDDFNTVFSIFVVTNEHSISNNRLIVRKKNISVLNGRISRSWTIALTSLSVSSSFPFLSFSLSNLSILFRYCSKLGLSVAKKS